MSLEISESPFLKVRDGELPGVILFTAEYCFAILTHAAVLDKNESPMRGHTLLVPNDLVGNIEELAPEAMLEISQLQCALSGILKSKFNKVKTEIHVSGHDVAHLHYHMVPANRGETDWSELPKEPNYSPADRLEDGERIQAALRQRDLGSICSKVHLPNNRSLPLNRLK